MSAGALRNGRDGRPSLPQHLCSRACFELREPLPDVVAMQTRQPNPEGAGEIPLRRLVKETLRMRPSRLGVGEVRQDECLDLLSRPDTTAASLCAIGYLPW
jgi:pilus assembly protein CpaF